MNNLRQALKSATRSPCFTLGAVLLLAVGLAANATIFLLLNAVLIRPLPGIAAPQELALIGSGFGFGPFSYPDYIEYRDQHSVSRGFAALTRRRSTSQREARACGWQARW